VEGCRVLGARLISWRDQRLRAEFLLHLTRRHPQHSDLNSPISASIVFFCAKRMFQFTQSNRRWLNCVRLPCFPVPFDRWCGHSRWQRQSELPPLLQESHVHQFLHLSLKLDHDRPLSRRRLHPLLHNQRPEAMYHQRYWNSNNQCEPSYWLEIYIRPF
jgi:hypothetical protein